jgi:hypothetical protein
MFQEEKPHLRPLPVTAFRIFTEVVRPVCDDTTVGRQQLLRRAARADRQPGRGADLRLDD